MATEYSCPNEKCEGNINGNKKYYTENIGKCPDCGEMLAPTQVKLKEYTGGTKGIKSYEQEEEEELTL
jgi:hypothetical protein